MTTSPHPVRINPTTWNAAFAYDQGQLRTMPHRLLTIAGQGPVDEDGALLHVGDVTAQLALSMRNVETVLTAAELTLADVTRLTIYTTDIDATLAAYDAVVERLQLAGATPPASLIGVNRLAFPGMANEIEATAAR